MPMRFKARNRVSEEVPTSSTADIAFLLIIFFMVTTVFAARKGFNMELPKQKEEQQPVDSDEEAIYIKVYTQGRFVVDNTKMTLGEMRTYIQGKLQVNSKKFVIIHPQDQAEFGYVIDALDEARQAGCKNISVPSKAEMKAWPYIPPFNDF